MSFKEYLNEAKNPFDEKTIKKLSDMTDRNYHTEVVLEIAKLLNNKKYIELMNAIQVIHEFNRSIPSELSEMRNKLLNSMLEDIKSKYGKETYEKLNSSL